MIASRPFYSYHAFGKPFVNVITNCLVYCEQSVLHLTRKNKDKSHSTHLLDNVVYKIPCICLTAIIYDLMYLTKLQNITLSLFTNWPLYLFLIIIYAFIPHDITQSI